jgi:hypothetical protein
VKEKYRARLQGESDKIIVSLVIVSPWL